MHNASLELKSRGTTAVDGKKRLPQFGEVSVGVTPTLTCQPGRITLPLAGAYLLVDPVDISKFSPTSKPATIGQMATK